MPIDLVLCVCKQVDDLPQHTNTASDSDSDKSELGDMSSLLSRLLLWTNSSTQMALGQCRLAEWPRAGRNCIGPHLDQSVDMVGCEVEAVEVESSEGWPAGHQLQKALACDPTALAHSKALQPCYFPQSLNTKGPFTSLLTSSHNSLVLTH